MTDSSRDDQVTRLRRQMELDPSDSAARQSYLVALMRADRREEALLLIREGFMCSQRWTELTPTPEQQQRHCQSCQKTVHFCWTLDELRRHTEDQSCVAAPFELVQSFYKRDLESLTKPKAQRSELCVLESELPWIEFDHRKVPDEILNSLDPYNAIQLEVLPYKRQGSILFMASALPRNIHIQDTLKRLTRAPSVQLALTHPEAIRNAINEYYQPQLLDIQSVTLGYLPAEDWNEE